MYIKKLAIVIFIISFGFLSCSSQTTKSKLPGGMSAVANKFLKTLSAEQKAKMQFSFNDQERYDWHYIPKSRKGISLNELNDHKKRPLSIYSIVLSAIQVIIKRGPLWN